MRIAIVSSSVIYGDTIGHHVAIGPVPNRHYLNASAYLGSVSRLEQDLDLQRIQLRKAISRVRNLKETLAAEKKRVAELEESGSFIRIV